jgi:two-component system, chemotaxis family, sensor kinase CheA
LKGFISEYVDGVLWESYIQKNKHKTHKVILQNKEKEATFTVSTNSILFEEEVFTTSVFTNIDELEIIRKEIERSHKELRVLFDNANEGFLYFDREMVIGSEYSLKAKEIFGLDIAHKYITDLLFQDEEEKLFIQETLVGILDETLERQAILISLLKDEFFINKRFIKVQYKVLSRNAFMLILSDITQNKYLNEKIKEEQQVYKMVITIMTFFEQFSEVKNDYQRFTNEIETFKSLEKLTDLRREVHTFKGLFAQFELLNIVKKLHSLENTIDYCLKIQELDDDIVYLSSKLLFSWLEVDLGVINHILKQDIFAKPNTLKIEKKRIENIYNNIEKYENLELLKQDIKQLTYRNIKDTFYAYGKLVTTLSQRFEKPMHELILDCEDIYLSGRYKPFLNALVHIFRNSLDHGIEVEEERIFLGKDPQGTISCDIKVVENNLEINYKDDGRGLDINQIKSKIVEKQLLSEEILTNLDEEEILMLIFMDSFSTKEVVTDISGRGVGLSSLQSEVKKLDGSLKITNHPTKGVEFLFTLPIVD